MRNGEMEESNEWRTDNEDVPFCLTGKEVEDLIVIKTIAILANDLCTPNTQTTIIKTLF